MSVRFFFFFFFCHVVGIIIFYIVFHFLSVWFSLLFVICILLRFFLCFPYLTGGHVKQTPGWKEESTLNVRHHLERMSSRGVDRVDFSVPLCLSSRKTASICQTLSQAQF
jgi:hypothetical protein